MNNRRTLLLFAALALAASSVVGAGSLSAGTMDRGVGGAVEDDSTAYLGFEQTPTNTSNDTTDLEVTITNQHSAGTELTTVEVTIGDTTVDLADDGPVDPGEGATHTFTSVACGGQITVEALGEGVGVDLDRSVACE